MSKHMINRSVSAVYNSVSLELPPFVGLRFSKFANMSTITRAIQTVRPHIPMIRFGKNQGVKEKSPLEMMQAVTSQQQASPKPAQNTASNLPKVGNTPRGSAILEDIDLPAKYRRKPISEEEIAFIERGGPE